MGLIHVPFGPHVLNSHCTLTARRPVSVPIQRAAPHSAPLHILTAHHTYMSIGPFCSLPVTSPKLSAPDRS
uniref:Uncharacterized protein n=1 Tax=Arundo donax TaxID=35708 RepID=A0A0A9B3P7_ARUDO